MLAYSLPLTRSIWMCSWLLLFSCTSSTESTQQTSSEPPKDPYEHLQDVAVKGLLQKSIASMGGLEAWSELSVLRFQKYVALYREDGSIEQEVIQEHSYRFQPNPVIRITWGKGAEVAAVVYEGGDIYKTVGGKKDTTASMSSLENTIFSSTFVMALPYNMLDPGAELSYKGKDTLDTGQAVEVLQAVYNPDVHENHTTPDTWNLYLDEGSRKLVAYQVQHADHYSYVINLSDTLVDGFTFVKERESFRVDSLRNRLYLRAKYAYSEYQVE